MGKEAQHQLMVNPGLRSRFLNALRASQGSITKACETAGVFYNDLAQVRKADPEFEAEIQLALQYYDDGILEKAICNLAKAVESGDLDVSKFVINTRGRVRGYGRDATPVANIQVNGSTINLEAVGGDDE